MENLLELADLLEASARALREAHQAMQSVPPCQKPEMLLKSVKGYAKRSVRLRKVLNRLGIKTVKEALSISSEVLLMEKGFGHTTLSELRGWLDANNLLSSDDPLNFS